MPELAPTLEYDPMNSWQYRYKTGWINRTDWTNVHLGSNTTLNTDSNVTHNLNAPLPNLLVKIFVSTDGTDANSFEIPPAIIAGPYGWTPFEIDNNNIKIQTCNLGLLVATDAGATLTIDTENYYYQAEVYFMG